MILVYYSRTNNVKRFVNKLGTNIKIQTIDEYDGSSPYILITPTYNFGKVPEEVDKFLETNDVNMVSVISSGNKNWGDSCFGRAGDIISKKYTVPLVHKFELSGNKKDVEKVDKYIESVVQ